VGVCFSSKQFAVSLLYMQAYACLCVCVCVSVCVVIFPRLTHFNAALSPDENIHILIKKKKMCKVHICIYDHFWFINCILIIKQYTLLYCPLNTNRKVCLICMQA